MHCREHPLVEDSHDNDAFSIGTVEDDVAFVFDAAKGRIKFDARPTSEFTLSQ